MKLIWPAALTVAMLTLVSAPAYPKPPIEAYGMPEARSAEISPDGRKIALLANFANNLAVATYDIESNDVDIVTRVQDAKTGGLSFATNSHLILRQSVTESSSYIRNRKIEITGAISLNLDTKTSELLLKNASELYPFQSGVGRIVGTDPDGEHVYMPAYVGIVTENSLSVADPSYDLFKVNLNTGSYLRADTASGTSDTIDWLVDSSGELLAREDHSEKRNRHTISVFDDGRRREIRQERTELVELSIVGSGPDRQKLYAVTENTEGFSALHEIDVSTGKSSGPVLTRADADIVRVLSDRNRVVFGVEYSGAFPSYEFFDPDLDADVRQLTSQFESRLLALRFDSMSDDGMRVLFHADGSDNSGEYILYDRQTGQLRSIIKTRPSIGSDDVGEILVIQYKARDGLTIPAIITLPPGTDPDTASSLPMVVLPHGGPAAADTVGFDWLAQYLSNEGYIILQPNFRGSAGLGAAFQDAGTGEWGRKMQDDITDGVEALTEGLGWADPDRVCIVGASYGGYAALMGGAKTPDLYACVAAIAGVSDLIDFLNFVAGRSNTTSRSYTYWTSVIGDPSENADAVRAISPSQAASNFSAPVLLIHGEDDTTVPIAQSSKMRDALERAGREVAYHVLQGDDHYLSVNESRMQVLELLGSFLAQHLGAAR